jgi:predicted amidohydrolase YtcJ
VADLALVNANVLTMDPARPRARAVTITGGRIEAVTADPAEARADRVVDLRGATLAPGFHDAHNHMIGFGRSLVEVNLSSPPIGSLDDLYAAVARRAEETAPGDWVMGSGYDQNKIGAHPGAARSRASPAAPRPASAAAGSVTARSSWPRIRPRGTRAGSASGSS